MPIHAFISLRYLKKKLTHNNSDTSHIALIDTVVAALYSENTPNGFNLVVVISISPC